METQKSYFSPNWINRLLFVVAVNLPNCDVPRVFPGAANCGVLKKLKNSERNNRRCHSWNGILNDFDSEVSHCLSPGPAPAGFLGLFP